jgi:tetratricopeptide (TPR) repeat protein
MKRRLMIATAFVGVTLLGLAGWFASRMSSPTGRGLSSSGWTGSSVCRECHKSFYEKWAPSHHGLAMQPFTVAFAQAQLTRQTNWITIGRERYQAEWNQQKGWVRCEGPAGARSHAILHVMGGKNVYYFLTELDRGRLQVLPVAFDVRRQFWYDTAASGVRHFPDMLDTPLHWTDRPYTFNVACYNCHVSQLSQNYQAASDSYHTTWAEPGINCETCHGPAGDHVQRARLAVHGKGKLEPLGIISTKPFAAEQMNSLCAPCHAKMVPLTTRFAPGELFFDHFDLTTLDHQDYYADGRDLGENYTFTSWRMNPCLKSNDFDCMHCHTSSGRFRFAQTNSDLSCLPCHQTIVAQIEGHTHHAASSSGSRCLACHMPTTEFARMRRTDHSSLPPAPAATLAFQSPNACNLCHTNQEAGWADGFVRQWYPRDYQAAVLHRGRLVQAARTNDWARWPAMVEYLQSPQRDEVTATSLIRLMRHNERPGMAAGFIKALSDTSPLIRASAAESLALRLDPQVVAALSRACEDKFRLVRIRAASALVRVPATDWPTNEITHVRRALTEYEQSLRVRPDDAASLHNQGNHAMALERWDEALRAFEAAAKLQPEMIAPLVNASIVYSRLGDNAKAEGALRRALQYAPTNASVQFNLGLLLAEEQRHSEAETALRQALRSDPRLAAAAYNLAVLTAARNLPESVDLLRRAVSLQPEDEKYGYTLAFYLRQNGDLQEAIQVLRSTVERKPSSLDPYLLLAKLYLERNQDSLAQAVYQEAMHNDKIPMAARQQLQGSPRLP